MTCSSNIQPKTFSSVTPFSLKTVIHHGEAFVMIISSVERGIVAGSSFWPKSKKYFRYSFDKVTKKTQNGLYRMVPRVVDSWSRISPRP